MIQIDGEKVKHLRESQELTQLYVATVVEVTTDTISRWENRRYPSIKKENGLKLAEALGVELDEILLLEEKAGYKKETASENTPVEPQKNTRPSAKLVMTAVGASVLLLIGFIAAFFLFYNTTHDVEIRAGRIMPQKCIPRTPFPVVVEITHQSSADISIILKEQLPENSEIIKIAPVSGSSNEEKEIKWLKKISSKARFFYLVQINDKPGTQFSFTGTVSTSNGADAVQVSGADSITLGKYHWADTDGDNRISDQEILTVFDYYSGIDDFTIDIEFIEKMWLGSSYRWDGKNNHITIIP